MNKLKHFFCTAKDSMKDNGLQIFEIVALIILTLVPFWIDVHKLFEKYLSDIVVSPDNVVPYLVIKSGNFIMSIALFIIGLWRIRSYNKDVLMNRRNIYHRYPYMWYYFCAKVLGIKKCSLILVPIYLQFKLVIHNVFEEFPLNDCDYPVLENEGNCAVIKYNFSNEYNEVNLMLEDTYPVYDSEVLDQIAAELGKIGSNMNQIARHLNQGNPMTARLSKNLNHCFADLTMLKTKIEEMAGEM